MEKKIILELKKNYSDLVKENIFEREKEELPIVCLTGNLSEWPNDFIYVVYDKAHVLRGKFANSEFAKEYAEFLFTK